MSRSEKLATWLPGRLAELVAEHGVPGAQVAVLVDGEVVDAAAGVLNLATGVETTTDSVFQVGSITKVWTATLVMQLVDDGLLDLDEPVVKYLPDFKVADAAANAVITTRQLLNHTVGIDGDLFYNTGSGEDAVAKYLGTITEAAQIHPPGAMFSYCNSGYVVLGRIVEVLRDKPFGAVLKERIAEPLGLAHLATNANEAILFRAALGHVPGPDGTPVPAPTWSLAPSNAPAGSLLTMSARDLLGWARAHLAGGGAILSGQSAAAMRTKQTDVPYIGLLAEAWGLGWELFGWGADVFGHDGGTIGQNAFLRVSGSAEVAVALLTNSLDGVKLYQDLVLPLMRELAGAEIPDAPTPPANPEPLDRDRITGVYQTPMVGHELSVDDEGRGWLEITPLTAESRALMAPHKVEVVKLRENSLIAVEQEHGHHQVLTLVGADDQGRAEYLFNSRAAVRTESE